MSFEVASVGVVELRSRAYDVIPHSKTWHHRNNLIRRRSLSRSGENEDLLFQRYTACPIEMIIFEELKSYLYCDLFIAHEKSLASVSNSDC